MTPFALFSSLARRRGWLWSYLVVRPHDRGSPESELECIRGGRDLLSVLSSGALLMKSGAAGRHRLIRMPSPPADAAQVALQAAEPSEP